MSFFNANQFSALTIATNRPGEGVTVDGVVLKGNSIFSDSCVFGANYKDSYNPPSNGLLVEGKMGLGTSSPNSNSMLHIDGGAGNCNVLFETVTGKDEGLLFYKDTVKAASLITNSDEDLIIENHTQNQDIIFKGNISSTATEFFRLDTSADSLKMNQDKKISFRDTGLYVNSPADGNLQIVSDTIINLHSQRLDLIATNQINIAESGVATTIKGTLDCDEAVNMDGTLTVEGLSTIKGNIDISGNIIVDGDSNNPFISFTSADTSTGTIASKNTVVEMNNNENKIITPQGLLKIRVGDSDYYIEYFSVST